MFGSLTGYGLYSKRIYLTSGNTTGISLYADTDTAKLTMKQSGNTIFDFDTATSTAKIAGWTIDAHKLYRSDLQAIYFGGSASDFLDAYSLANTIVFGRFNSTSTRLVMRGDDTSSYVQAGISSNKPFIQASGRDTVSDPLAIVNLGVDFNLSNKFGFSLKYNNEYYVKFFKDDISIAGWKFTTTYFQSPQVNLNLRDNYLRLNAGSSLIGQHIYLDVTAVGTPGYMSFGRILDVNGAATNDMGIAAFIDGQKYFYLSTGERSIAGWNFDTAKFTKGSAAAGLSLNTSSSPFITGNNSKGFEVYDVSSPKMFIGLRDGSGVLSNGMDWNITSANKLTIKGDLVSSQFSTTNSLGHSIVQTYASMGGGGTAPYVFVRKYVDANNDCYLNLIPDSTNLAMVAAAVKSGTNSFVNIDFSSGNQLRAVSYTHLTLPTKRIV